MIYIIDIDGVLTTRHDYGTDYERAEPNAEVIVALKRLTAQGHEIRVRTGRNPAHHELTLSQLRAWNVPAASIEYADSGDFIVDDRALAVADLIAHSTKEVLDAR